MPITSLFHTEIYSAKIDNPALLKALKQECVYYCDKDTEGHQWSEKNYIGGYTSYGSLDKMHQISGTFAQLEKVLNRHVKNYAKKLQWDIDAKKLRLQSLWINIMPAQVTHSWHLHPYSVISGTYYVQTPKACSAIKFEDPRWSNFMLSPMPAQQAKTFRQRHHSIQPQAGSIVLFESWLKHEVPAHTADSERISISFNYEWDRA
ncbi:MAG: TIGR02466 family protein [Pseudobdellovibrionaceae bacterium]